MSGSINKVILIGNLGKDPEIKATQNGKELANLTVATSEYWKDKSTGARKEKTEWHKVVVFNKNIVGLAKTYLAKGSKVYIEGSLQTRKWQDQTGKDCYSTEIVIQEYAGNLTMLSKNQDSAAPLPADQADTGLPLDDNDDEIPF